MNMRWHEGCKFNDLKDTPPAHLCDTEYDFEAHTELLHRCKEKRCDPTAMEHWLYCPHSYAERMSKGPVCPLCDCGAKASPCRGGGQRFHYDDCAIAKWCRENPHYAVNTTTRDRFFGKSVMEQAQEDQQRAMLEHQSAMRGAGPLGMLLGGQSFAGLGALGDPEGQRKAEEGMRRVGSFDYPPSPKKVTVCDKLLRTFKSGATRDSAEGKYDYEGFLSPAVLEWYAKYMHHHRKQSDGELRDSDNWQKGIPREQYMKSMWRHFMEVWEIHRSGAVDPPVGTEQHHLAMEEALPALLFNVMGYMFELTEGR